MTWSLFTGGSNQSVFSLPYSGFQQSGRFLAQEENISRIPILIYLTSLHNAYWYRQWREPTFSSNNWLLFSLAQRDIYRAMEHRAMERRAMEHRAMEPRAMERRAMERGDLQEVLTHFDQSSFLVPDQVQHRLELLRQAILHKRRKIFEVLLYLNAGVTEDSKVGLEDLLEYAIESQQAGIALTIRLLLDSH